jgi:two-component system, chemotaxis family, chemotaxis protein CheY
MEIRAMVVDDSGIMRKMVMRSLVESRLAQFTFTEAVDGLDALQKFVPDQVDIVFVDWNMPNMSGIDFVRCVREACPTHVPIVMVTTESTMVRVEEALDSAGVDTYICKPFTTEALVQNLTPLFEAMKTASQPKGGFFSKLVSKLD